MKKNYKGFTLIELLVVIAIIGLLSTLAVVALNNARLKSRDARRVADVKQIQTALELYFNDEGAYPSAVDTTGGSIAGTDVTYMNIVPTAPEPPSGNTYTYTQDAATTYTLEYTIEGPVGGMTCSTYPCTLKATSAGIRDD